jgi:uncharacterized membrane protein
MSWRLSVPAVLVLAVACSDGSNPMARPVAHPESAEVLPVDPTIKMRVLPDLDGNNVFATGLNRNGVVTGFVTNGSTSRVFRFDHKIEYFTPPSGFQPGNFFGIQAGINDRGTVAGGIINDTAQRAFLWSRDGRTTLLPPTFPQIPPEEPLGCGAFAISDSGYVVGTCMPNVNQFETEWAPDGSIARQTCCGVLTATAENRNLTGFDLTFDPPIALLWPPGAPFYTLIGLNNGAMEESEGLAVNDNAWVAGWAIITGEEPSAILWVPGQPQRILSHVGQAMGIDAEGNVVGFHLDSATGPSTAFLWNFATGAHFLPGFPGGTGTAAVAINARHEILGTALDKNGVKHTVIWRFPPRDQS